MKNTIQSWLTEQFGDDAELHAELYAQYAADMKALLAEVTAAESAGDAAALGEKGHAMKGMAFQMGDGELSEPCLALQNAGRAGDLATCSATLAAIRPLVAAL